MSVICELVGYLYHDITNLIPSVRRRREAEMAARLAQAEKEMEGLIGKGVWKFPPRPIGSIPTPRPWPDPPPGVHELRSTRAEDYGSVIERIDDKSEK